MAKLNVQSSLFDFESDNDHKDNIHLYMDDQKAFSDDVKGEKVLFLCEPSEITGLSRITISNRDKVDHILTHDDDVLEQCDNAHLFEFGTSWVDEELEKREDKNPIIEKNFSVSHLTGFKTWTKGHQLRQKVWYKQKKIKIPKNFYLSKHNKGIENFVNAPILGDSKMPLFDSMFHIAIENCRKGYYFSEKLVDAFRTYTIPIYWGCPHIEDYFNMDGIIVFEDFKDLLRKVNRLEDEDYFKRKEAVYENYELAKRFFKINNRLNEKIKQITQ